MFLTLRIVHAAEAPDDRVVLQVVRRRLDVSVLDPWGDRPRTTRIVAIGTPDGIDAADLDHRLGACIVPDHTTMTTISAS